MMVRTMYMCLTPIYMLRGALNKVNGDDDDDDDAMSNVG